MLLSSMKKRWFGTDGIRGLLGVNLRKKEIIKISYLYAKHIKASSILIGMDSRNGNSKLLKWIATGISNAKAKIHFCGILPTPAISYLAKLKHYDGAISITASHNLPKYNGIKFFKENGVKLSEEDEQAIELQMNKHLQLESKKPKIEKLNLDSIYLNLLKKISPKKQFNAVMDFSNGACSKFAHFFEEHFGIKAINMRPNGNNINIADAEIENEIKKKAALGFAFDGDGDRCIVFNASGKKIDGDKVIIALSSTMRIKKGIVVTDYSNHALDEILKNRGIPVFRVKNGDKYVINAIYKNKYEFGGEKSGHLVFPQYSFCDDGMLTAIKLLNLLNKTNKSIEELTTYQLKPSILINVPVKKKKDFFAAPTLVKAIESTRRKLSQRGRLLIRYSGTEPICRIMIEANERKLLKLGWKLAKAVSAELN
ncbi:hypothetical protein DRZ77_02375 [Candidatus Woesearchaeota archaeon]|nr:MAG: hypothetical protein DRZ77_02375 [Candidatus Woesearchaeota archaeon]